MTDHTEYRIEYTIQRCLPGEDDFSDIGFGSSGAAHDIVAALYTVQSNVQNLMWETESGMPTPESVQADIKAAEGLC